MRAVVLTGSRADPTATADRYRDHDVVFVVDDVAPYRADPAWIDVFGECAIVQRPDDMFGATPRPDGGETWLMLFTDGSRIDLTLLPVTSMHGHAHDGPARVLLDRDGVVPPPPQRGAPHHPPGPPSAAQFADVCNEFWWVAPYVAKGLVRGETTYAHHHLDGVLREQLLTALGWDVAGDDELGPGKHGRNLRRVLPAATWARLEATYAGADRAATWAALDAMCDLFHDVAGSVARRYGFAYPERDEARIREHLRTVRRAAPSGSGTPRQR